MKQPFCKECGKGSYQDRDGQRACKPCPAGSYCQATKMAAPTPCPAGKYGTKASSITPTDCQPCPINVSGCGGGAAAVHAVSLGAPLDAWCWRSRPQSAQRGC